MASKGADSVSANVPKISQFSPYTIPAENVTVKYEEEPSDSDISKKEKKCIKKSRQKGSLGEINAENLEGHKNFDNIEDILTFINGTELENGNESKNKSKKGETENSLGANKKTFSFKDKYSSTNTGNNKKDEKEKFFFKKHDSAGEPTNIIEEKDEQVASESFISNNKEDSETCAKLKKFYDQIERKDIFDSSIEAVGNAHEGPVPVVEFMELSKNFIEMCDFITVAVEYENRISLDHKLEMIDSFLDHVTDQEKKIESLLSPLTSINQSVPPKISQMVEVIGEAKKGLKVLEKQTKLKQEVFQLYRKEYELNTKQIESMTEQMALTEESMNNISLDQDLVFTNLVQKHKEVLNLKCDQLEEVKEEKKAQNKVVEEALKKFEELETKSESPKNEFLSTEITEYKPTKLLKEDAKPETLRDPLKLPRESTYELTFHKTSLTTCKTSGKEDRSGILNNIALVVPATNFNILEWGIDKPHPEAHKKLDEENQRRRCSKDICKKCNHDMKGCGLDLHKCDRCELVMKAISYHKEYTRIVEIVDQGGWGKQIKRRAEGLAKDAMRYFQNVMIPFLVSFINGKIKHFLEHLENMPVEKRGAAKLKDVWERLQYAKFPLQRVRIDQDYLDVLQQQADNLMEANLEYEDVLDEVHSYINSWKKLVELWDSNVTPNLSVNFQEMEKDLDSWTKCADDFKSIANEVFSMINTVKNASKSGSKVEMVDLKCVETFLCSAQSFTNSAKNAVIQKIPLKMVQKMHWAKELITKIHCVQCRKVILVPGENLVHLEKCSVCKAARYCNTTCQQLQWEDHKDKCEQLKKMEKKRKRKESRAGEKLIQEREKFWDQVLKPILCRPGVTVETLEKLIKLSRPLSY